MKKDRALDRRLTVAALGSVLLLIGVLGIVPGEQDSLVVFGIGVILLTLNLLRYIRGIKIGYFSAVIGASLFVLGSWALVRRFLGYPLAFEIQLFPLILISLGIYLLIPNRTKSNSV